MPLCRFASQAVAFVSPDCRPCPAGLKARRTRSARRPGRTFSRLSRPAKFGPGPSPRSLTVIRRARVPARVRIPSRPRGFLTCLSSVSAWPRHALGRIRAIGNVAAYAHAVCGDRIFPATLAIDDPGVTDELTLPAVNGLPSTGRRPRWDSSSPGPRRSPPASRGRAATGPTWEHPRGFGWNGLDTELQWQACASSDASSWPRPALTFPGRNGTGTGAHRLAEHVFARGRRGLGFGALPTSMNSLRPFAITAEISTTTPGQGSGRTATNVSRRSTGGSHCNTACPTSIRSRRDRQRLPQASHTDRRVRFLRRRLPTPRTGRGDDRIRSSPNRL